MFQSLASLIVTLNVFWGWSVSWPRLAAAPAWRYTGSLISVYIKDEYHSLHTHTHTYTYIYISPCCNKVYSIKAKSSHIYSYFNFDQAPLSTAFACMLCQVMNFSSLDLRMMTMNVDNCHLNYSIIIEIKGDLKWAEYIRIINYSSILLNSEYNDLLY